jgi:hypothetical protein
MDCYIIRVYRHSAGENDQPEEIAGLVEPVGKSGSSRPFSSYQTMFTALREELSGASDRNTQGRATNPDLQLVHASGKTSK